MTDGISQPGYRRRLRFEPLELRRMLSITVDTLVDENNGIGAGAGTSLREAIAAAAPGDTINFSVTGTINLAVGSADATKHLTIDKNLTIDGPGADLLTINAFDPTPTQKNGDGSRVLMIGDNNGAVLLDVFISGLTLTGGDVSLDGGGAIWTSENLLVSNCAITNNRCGSGGTAFPGGGAIQSIPVGGATPLPNSLTIRNSILSGNTAPVGEGGAIRKRYGSLTIEDCTIADNSAYNAGGGISVADGQVSVQIARSTLNNNRVTRIGTFGYGGGIFIYNGTLFVATSALTANTAAQQGGAIEASSANVTLNDTQVTGNTASGTQFGSGGGGGICQSNGTLIINGATISSNTAVNGGGLLQLGGALQISASTFENNVATATGGGIDAYNTHLTIAGTTLSDNTAGGQGGGIRLTNSDSAFAMTDCQVLNNSAFNSSTSGNGGGLYLSVTGLVASIDESTFTGNIVKNNGGGIYFSNGSSLQITNSTIDHNTARVSGGGIYTSGSLIVGDCQILQNSVAASGNGGGIAISGAPATVAVNGSTISGNTADARGGGIDAGNANVFLVTNSLISNNKAPVGNGGGISGGVNTTVFQSTFDGNSAGAGGGIAMRSFAAATGVLIVKNSTVSNNSAGRGGGGILTVSDLSGTNGAFIVNSTISANTALYGAGIENDRGLVSIQHSTITKNQALPNQGSGIASDDGANRRTELTSSIVAGNMNSDVDSLNGSGASFQSNGYNLIGTGNALSMFNQSSDQTGILNPMLAPLADNGGPTMTHLLLAGSLAIDAGDPGAVAGMNGLPLYDQRGNPYTRVWDGDGTGGARIDIGAVEVQTLPLPNAVYGDFNADGVADSADYVSWRKTTGTTVTPYTRADGSGNGIVGPEDYDVWQAHYGETIAPATGAAAAVLTATLNSLALDSAPTEASVGQPSAPLGGALERQSPAAPFSILSSIEAEQHAPRVLPPAEPPSGGPVHDDALLAWMATRGTTCAVARINSELPPSDLTDGSNVYCDALDVAVTDLVGLSI